MELSDFLDEAPDLALKQFIDGVSGFPFNQMKEFGQDCLDYLRSDEFILSKRPIYLKRSRNLTHSDMGKYRSLFDSAQRLYDSGLIGDSDIDNTVFTWTTKPNFTRLGYCSTLMRVVTISSVFDDLEIPDEEVDYVVYHECLHLRQGYRPFDSNPHDAAFHRDMKLFPDGQKFEKML